MFEFDATSTLAKKSRHCRENVRYEEIMNWQQRWEYSDNPCTMTSQRWKCSSTGANDASSSILLSADTLFPSLIKAEVEAWKRMDFRDDESSAESTFIRHGNSVQSIHSYFKNLDSSVCCMSIPRRNANIYSKVRVPTIDGRDSGIEDSTISGIDLDRQDKTLLDQKEFSVYKHALLCAQFPVLGSVSPHPSSACMTNKHTISLHNSFNFLPIPQSITEPNPFSEDTDIDDDTDTSIQVQTLCVVVRQAFQLSEERHLYYDDIISEGYNRKSPAKILIDELVSRLTLLENNKHPFYSPFAFENRNAYDLWQQQERCSVIDLYSKFWKYSLPTPSSKLCNPNYWSSIHEEYRDLMVKLIRSGSMCHNVSRGGWIFSSSCRRLLKEFGLRYGVGEIYRKAVYLEYLADNLELEVWYLNHLTSVVGILVEMISQIRTRMLIVRKEFEILHKTACKLHDHCSHCFTRLQRLFSDQNPSVGVECLINLLDKVLELKTYLTGKKCSSLEYYLQKYMKDSFSLAYERYKLIGATELKLHSYTTPLSPKLMNLLLLNIRNEVDYFQEHYQKPFEKFFDLTALATQGFYKPLMQDIAVLCEQCLQLEHSNEIDLMMLSLAYRLNQLDIKWKQYIPIRLQVWRHQFHSQAKLWQDVLHQHVLSLVIQAVGKETYKTLLLHKEGYLLSAQHPRNSSFLQASQTSAFSAVTGSRHISPSTVQAEINQPQLKSFQKNSHHHISKLSTQTPLQMELPFSNSVEINSGQQFDTHHQEHRLQVGRGTLDNSQLETKEKRQVFGEDDSVFYTPTMEMVKSQIENSKVPQTKDDEKIKPLSDKQCEANSVNDFGSELAKKFIAIAVDTKERCSSSATTPCSQYEDACSQFGKESPIKTIGNQRMMAPDYVSSVGSPTRFLSSDEMMHSRGFLLSASSFETASEGTFYPRSFSPSEVSSRMDSPCLYRPHASVPQNYSKQMSREPSSDSMRSNNVNSMLDDIPLEKVPFSNSVFDMVCIIQRFAEFMHSLCSTIYPIIDGELGNDQTDINREAAGDSGVFSGRSSMATASMPWNTAAFQMREELAIKMYMTVTSCLQVYANNMLSIDLCATPATLASTLVTSQVLDSITFSKKQGLIWGCRHMLNGCNNCNKYLSRNAEYVSDAFEPVTEQMCIRINNIAALLNLMPSFNGLLATVFGDLDSPLYMGMEDLHKNLWHQCECHLQHVADGQVKLLGQKLNLFVHQAIKLLTNLNMVGYTIAKRLQPITDFLDNHMMAFTRWLYPEYFQKVCHTLWENIVQDFTSETELLKILDDKSDSHALLLLQGLGHMIEFMYNEGHGLDIDVLLKSAEHTMYLLQLHSMDTRHLIGLYKQLLSQKIDSKNDTSSVRIRLPSADILHSMSKDLYADRTCFHGLQLVKWIQSNTQLEDPQGVCQTLLDFKVIQAINHSKNRKKNGTPTSWNSKVDSTPSTSQVLPEISVDSTPSTSQVFPEISVHSTPSTSQVFPKISVHSTLSTSQIFPEISIHSTPYSQFLINHPVSDFFNYNAFHHTDSDSDKSFQSTKLIVEQGIVNEGFVTDDISEGVLKTETYSTAMSARQFKKNNVLECIDNCQTHLEEKSDLQYNYLTLESFENLSQVGCEKELRSHVKTEVVQPSESNRLLQNNSSVISPTSDITDMSSQASSSSRIFIADEFNFYRFPDINDEDLYNMVSQASESHSFTSHKHHCSDLHSRDKAINPEFVISIIYNRRKVNRLAKAFSEGISSEVISKLKAKSNKKFCMCI